MISSRAVKEQVLCACFQSTRLQQSVYDADHGGLRLRSVCCVLLLSADVHPEGSQRFNLVLLLLQVLLSEDVPGAANKLIAIKSEFPKADVFSIMASRPKTLLQSEEKLVDNAKKVCTSVGCSDLSPKKASNVSSLWLCHRHAIFLVVQL